MFTHGRVMKIKNLLYLSSVGLLAGIASAGVTFGTGANSFEMEFVEVGNAGNVADDTGYGAVDYVYQMGTHEVSRDMITKYNASAGTVAVTLADLSMFLSPRANMPATGMSWNGAARFVNWLNTSTGGVAAYKFTGTGANDSIALWASGDAGYDPNNEFRNSQAKYVLPSEDEWYKAAYHSNTGYTDYATQSDTAPIATTGGTTAGTAVYGQGNITPGPADITDAGGLSYYGTMAQNGNAAEWGESALDGVNDLSSGETIVFRGGTWVHPDGSLESSTRDGQSSANGALFLGFRVAVVPEPSTGLLTMIGAFSILVTRTRR